MNIPISVSMPACQLRDERYALPIETFPPAIDGEIYSDIRC
jgi:hypothetical protein